MMEIRKVGLIQETVLLFFGEWALRCESADQRFEFSFGMPKKLFLIWVRSEIVFRDKGRRTYLV
jgi:hypothetical protein